MNPLCSAFGEFDIVSHLPTAGLGSFALLVIAFLGAWAAIEKRGAWPRVIEGMTRRRLARAVSLISVTLVLVMIVDEFGMMAGEWGWRPGFSDSIRDLLSITTISVAVYLANLVLAWIGVYELVLAALRGRPGCPQEDRCQEHAAREASFMVCVFFCVTALAFLLWEGGIVPGVLAALVALVILLTVARMSRTDVTAGLSDQDTRELQTISILSLISPLQQTMVTKASLLLVVFASFRNALLRLVARAQGRRHAERAASELTDFCTSIDQRDSLSLLSLTLFVATSLPQLAIWAIQVSPLPPTSGLFAGTATLTSIWTVDTVLLIVLGVRSGAPAVIRFAAILIFYADRLLLPFILPGLFETNPAGAHPLIADSIVPVMIIANAFTIYLLFGSFLGRKNTELGQAMKGGDLSLADRVCRCGAAVGLLQAILISAFHWATALVFDNARRQAMAGEYSPGGAFYLGIGFILFQVVIGLAALRLVRNLFDRGFLGASPLKAWFAVERADDPAATWTWSDIGVYPSRWRFMMRLPMLATVVIIVGSIAWVALGVYQIYMSAR